MRSRSVFRGGWLLTWIVLMALSVLSGCGLRMPEVDGAIESSVERPLESTGDGLPLSADLAAYVNEAYGFRFRYPSEWERMEGEGFVSLNHGSIRLVVGYRHVTEDPNLIISGHLSEGELVEEGTVRYLGGDLAKASVRCGARTKAVLYEGNEEVAVGDLRFLFYVADFDADQYAANIPTDLQSEVDQVIESLTIFEVAHGFATATPAPTRLPGTPEPTRVAPTRVAVTRKPGTPRPGQTVAEASPNGAPVPREPIAESEAAGAETTEAAPETPGRAVAEGGLGGALIRTRPGPDQEIAGVLRQGERAEITGRYVNWWQIVHDGRSGWVFNAAVQTANTGQVPVIDPHRAARPEPGPPVPVDSDSEPGVSIPGGPVAEAHPGGANVRTGPAFRFNRIGFLQGGERVGITGWHAEWWQIEYEGRLAWVYSGVVRAYGTEDVPEVVTAPTLVPRMPEVVPTAAPPAAIDEERWIDVSLSEQRLTAYENGEVVRTTLISTGRPQTPTPTGQFRIWIKLRYDTMTGPGYHLPNVPYAMYFYGCYGMHGTYWHSNFGQPMSAGCVNLPTPEAAWVYDFVDIGTLVNVRP